MKFALALLASIFICTQTFAQAFKAGDKVEVRDNDGSWLLSQVLETDPVKGFKIHYIGWDAHWDTWVGNDRIRTVGSTKPAANATTKSESNNVPEMNGSIPNITGTAWWLLAIYPKGATPDKNTFTHYPYIFGNNGRYEMQFPRMTTMGKYTVKGNVLTQAADGSDGLTEYYTLKWNAAGNYLELVGSKTIIRLVYNREAAF
jgi:RNA binding chromodomain-containing protein